MWYIFPPPQIERLSEKIQFPKDKLDFDISFNYQIPSSENDTALFQIQCILLSNSEASNLKEMRINLQKRGKSLKANIIPPS